MAAKSSIIPILRQISSKYVSRNVVPARLFTACSGQLNSYNGGKWVSSANVIPRLFEASKFQSRNASIDGRSSPRSRKVVSEEEEEDYDDEEFDEGDSDVDEISTGSEDDLEDIDASESADSDSE
ncbi:hypothetical protein SUGI_0295320 [Cryptomeria japonica]|uniref:uncharacterized protein LOC131078357 n=1 Tax=Cryptomeria japonica TaxID=3369 RepID=UPI002408934D|nr:uncharacterized protein LOC131078357 [Cryptomeria japonica]GLJ17068.1 hypothetical protein SUGI_0295320 [Cryptomeria japonica]